jgi:DUF3047 family protein
MSQRSLTISFPLLFILATLLVPPAIAQERRVLFREDFASLDNWKPFYFPKIEKHSAYSIERNKGRRYLKAESSASASAIVFREPFNVYDYPNVRWRWKIERVYKKGDTKTKAGDDYPLRVYVMFEYDPEQAGAFEKMKYGLLKSLYGVYPPHSSLNYVWANKEQAETIATSPYTDQSKMVLLQKGAKKAGTWQDESVDIVEDYQKAFGKKPPTRARLAIMNDSDNTGESSVSYVEYIEVFRRTPVDTE